MKERLIIPESLIDDASDILTSGDSGYNNIRTFGVIATGTADTLQQSAQANEGNGHTLCDCIDRACYVSVRQTAYLWNKKHASLLIFNISFEALTCLAEEYGLKAFLFCTLNSEGRVTSQLYGKSSTSSSYNEKPNRYVPIESKNEWIDTSVMNDCVIAGDHFKYTIPFKAFESFEHLLDKNLEDKFHCTEPSEKEAQVSGLIEHAGESAWFIRGIAYEGLYTNMAV